MPRIISIDCGYRNLATSFGTIDHEKVVIKNSDVTDVLNGKKKKNNHQMVYKVLHHLKELVWNKWGIRENQDELVIICEKQCKGCNIPIGYGIFGLFHALFPRSDFIFMPPKAKFLGSGPTTASNLKQAAVQEVKTMLNHNHNVTLMPQVRRLFISLRKKDDISDTILQIQSFAYQNNYLTLTSGTSEKRENGEPHRGTTGTPGDLTFGSTADRVPDQQEEQLPPMFAARTRPARLEITGN